MRAHHLFFRILTVVAGVEIFVMVILGLAGMREGMPKNLLDAFLLSLLSAPLLYLFVVKRVDRRLSEQAVLSRKVLEKEMELETAAEKQELATRLQSLVNNVPGMVYRGHRDWSVSFIGAEVEQVTGHAAEDFMSGAVGLKEILCLEDRGILEESFREAVKDKSKILRVEYRIRHKNGGIRWIEDRRQMIYDETGAFAHVDGLLLDITERKRMEKQIRSRMRDLDVLYSISRASTQSLKLPKMLEDSVEATKTALKVDAVGLYLLDPDGRTMTLCVHRGLSDDFVKNTSKIALGEGISGRAADGKNPVALNVQEYPSERLAPYIVREGFQSLASTPLISAGKLVGAMNLATRAPRTFPPEELELLATIGQMLGQAIHDAQLYDSLLKETIEHRQTEEALRVSLVNAENEKARTEAIIAAIGDGLSIQDRDYRILYQNQIHKNLIGDHVGEFCYKAYERQDRVCEGCPVDRSFRDGKIHKGERIGQTDEGPVCVEITASPLKDASGNIIAGIELVRDMTARTRSEEDLRDAHQRLRFHVTRMPLAYIVWDREFRVVEWNPAAERIFGWKAEEALGKHPYELIVTREAQAHVSKVWQKLLEGEESSYSLNANIRKDGKTVTCEWFNAPLRDASGKVTGVLSMVHDVTEKTQLERQLQTAQRMEAVGTLAGGIAHDFNNALTGIFGFGEMLQSQLAGNERALSNLNEVLRCAERASALTRQLLTYSRRQIIEPVNLNLNAVITDLLKLVSKVVGAHIELRTSLAKDLPTIRADVGQMEQVVMNLALNARDAMPEGGPLVIETGLANLDAEYVRYHPYMSIGQYVVLTISDTGIGMDEKTQERVFEPFFTTKGPDKGTGLGLAMVYGIVKQHNGFIHLYSEPGKGTTFKVYLPPVEVAPERNV